MRFFDFYKRLSPKEKTEFARNIGTSTAYLSHIAHGHRMPGGKLMLAILRESKGTVTPAPESFGGPKARQDEAA